MSEPRTTSEANPSPSGRESNGRFAKGNPGSPSNPFARKCAAFRAALMEAVSEQDIQDIAAKLRDDAKAGDKAAIKLLFQYVIGKPQTAVDPDTLDGHEMRTFAANALPPETIEQMQEALPLGWLLKIWPHFLAAREQQCVHHLGDQFAAADEKEQRRAERAREKAERKQRRQEAREKARQQFAPVVPAPSANGDHRTAVATGEPQPPSPKSNNGQTGFVNGNKPPSPDGDNGHDLMNFIARWLNGRQQRPGSNGKC